MFCLCWRGDLNANFLSTESGENANSEGIKKCINKAFERIGITNFSKKLLGLNVDGTSINSGIHNGLGALTKCDAQWLQHIHCFNHCTELALKDALANTAFQNIEQFFSELYFLYKSSPKLLRELQRIGEAYGTTVPKPINVYGMRCLIIKSGQC